MSGSLRSVLENPLPGTAAAGDDRSVVTTGVWFGSPERPAFGWLSQPLSEVGGSGVIVLPPIGYAYWSSHRTLRVLAERLAAAGHQVLRIDYDGTGDAAGDQWDPDRVAAWRASVRAAADEVRQSGASRLVLVGARLGATLALIDARELRADRVVAWAPAVSGRRYAKEIRLLSTAVPEDADPVKPPGTRVFAGNVFAPQTLADISRLAISQLTSPPAPSVLVVDDADASAADAVEHLRRLGCETDHVQVEASRDVLETAPEFAVVPEAVVAEIAGWVGVAQAPPAPRMPAQASPAAAQALRATDRTVLRWLGREVTEEVVRIGERRHVGIVTAPATAAVSETTLVLLNPGSETHIGPGRAWVEYARTLASRGYRSVRVDFLGWGESPDAERAPGRPYDECCESDTIAIVDGLAAAGHGRIVLFGLCASAWIALRAVLEARVAGLIAMNPQMYWRRGDQVDIDWDRIRARRMNEIKRVELGYRLHLWDVLDLLGQRPRVARWLSELDRARIPVELLFAQGDDGIVFLRQRAGRRLNRLERDGAIRVRELPGVDHPMHLTWTRPRVVAALEDALRWIDSFPAHA